MLMGEFHHNIDEKGRLILPSKFRDDLGEEFVVTRLNNLPFTKKDARSFMRFFLSGATATVFDKQGRINITSPLISYAGLEKECVIVGVGDRLEIWDKDKWDNFYDMNKEEMSNIAEDLFDSNWESGE